MNAESLYDKVKCQLATNRGNYLSYFISWELLILTPLLEFLLNLSLTPSLRF